MNVGEYHHFAKVLNIILSRSTYFAKSKFYTSPQLREDIFTFQFAALKQQYFKLADAKSLEVFKVLGGAERQLTLHSYIFDVLIAIHKKDKAGLDNLCIIMACDARTKSLNICLRHRRAKPPSAKACPPVAPNLTADEFTADDVQSGSYPSRFAVFFIVFGFHAIARFCTPLFPCAEGVFRENV